VRFAVSFRDIKGQGAAVAFLRNSVTSGRLANAYMFCGPSGIGKRLAALNFAKAINCMAPDEGAGCDNCSSCKKIDSFNHPDVRLAAPGGKGSSVGIDDIRIIIKDIGLKPYEAKRKIYIIDGADSLTEEASNALLKTLEDPPSDSTLILIAENPGRFIATIRSRCQEVKFFLLDASLVEEILTVSHNVDSVKAHVLARISCGSPGGALELKSDDFFSKREQIIRAISSNTLLDMDFDKTPRSALRAVLNIMLTWYRDILVTKSGDRGLVNVDKRDLISVEADRMGFDRLNDILERIILTQTYLDQNANPRLAMAALGLAI